MASTGVRWLPRNFARLLRDLGDDQPADLLNTAASAPSAPPPESDRGAETRGTATSDDVGGYWCDRWYDGIVPKQKISVTVSPERLRRARAVTGDTNLSELLDNALDALIDRELERRWLEGHENEALDRDLPDEVPVDLGAAPWDHR